MFRADIINTLIKKINAKKYLEIGVSNGINFASIKCDYKVGVDPDLGSPATVHLTSDSFFETNQDKFDVIFIDGLHHSDQVYRDIINSLNVLNGGGYIVCHDMSPWNENVQLIPLDPAIHTYWTGDCWKAFVQLRRERRDLSMYVVDTDCGCGIIQRGNQELLSSVEELTWNNLEKNRKEWLNLISPETFLQKINTPEEVKTINYSLDNLLNNYIFDPDHPEKNFLLGYYYESIGQTAAALSFYLRTAERTENDLLKYESLIRGSMCFDKQGTRNFTVKGMLQHAIAVLPTRPEAYYLLSRFYERQDVDGSWNDSYLIASIGKKVCDLNPSGLITKVDYPGNYALQFQKALSSWWCGLCSESRDLFQDLLDNYQLCDEHKKICIDNLKKMNAYDETPFPLYNKKKHSKMKFKFNDSEKIEKNFSEAYQDMFVLSMLNGKNSGTYLEIGAGNPFYGNNTALLEQQFNWTGVSLDIDEGFVNAHNQERKNPCLLKDATKINYENFLSGMGFSNEIDYLQLDCDPPEVTYKILLTIPFETYKFAVITYEHDYYCDETKSFQEKSRKYLESYGYIRIVNNISPDDVRSYEDWWVHPDLIDNKIINKMLDIDETIKKAEDYILSGNETEEVSFSEFDWGLIEKNAWFRETVEKEIFIDDIYQKFFKVEKDDIVFDVGASVGPFTHHVKKQNPKKVYCFEPHEQLYKTLVKNVSSENVVCINKCISFSDTEHTTTGLFNEDITDCFSDQNKRTVPSIKFSTFIKENGIQKIDFLKSDCEGGEYDIFNQENFEWIKRNVKKISGEWHLVTREQKDLFRKFRDTYLKELPNHQIFSIDNVDIKWALWDDWFIENYGLITLYIDNRSSSENNTETFDWGLFEKNKWLSVPIKKEFENSSNYEKLFQVEKDDLVVDIGASVGPFTHSILSKNPKHVICLEPHRELFKTLKSNFSDYENVKCINKGISSVNGEIVFENLFDDTLDENYVGDSLWKKHDRGEGITFKTLINENHIEKIDFLKIDCEGGEYDVFSPDNFYWIKNNVKKIAGEWHLHTEEMKQEFLLFRDFYLRKFENFKIFFVDYNSNFFDITNEVWSNDFVTKYGWVNIYIDNR